MLRLSNSLSDPSGAITQQCADAAKLLENLVSCDQVDFGTTEGGQAHEIIALLLIQWCLLSQNQHLPLPMLKRMARFLRSNHTKALLTHCVHKAVCSRMGLLLLYLRQDRCNLTQYFMARRPNIQA
jgi:hypothetical protein